MSNSGLKDSLIYPLIVAIVGAVVGGAITYFIQDKNEDSMVKAMSYHFESVDENMELEHALDLIYKENEKTKDENEKLQKASQTASDEKKSLEEKISQKPDVEIFSPSLVIEGLKEEESIGKGVAVIDGKTYYSEKACSLIWGKEPDYKKENNTVFFNQKGNTSKETKTKLIGSGVIYETKKVDLVKPDDNASIHLGSDFYSEGLVFSWDGYALFDLKGQYSKLDFDVARVPGTSNCDAVLNVFLDDNFSKEYTLDAESAITHISVDLNYAKILKLTLGGPGSWAEYGLVNCTLEK